MIAVPLNEAKAKLNKLVEKARAGEQVVLLRGSEVVATIVPLSAEELEISPSLSDAQAKRFWDEVKGESFQSYPTAAKAVAALKKRVVRP